MKSLLPSLFSLLPGRRPGPSRRSAPVSPGVKPRGGFTLLELVAVIGIISVMSVIVVSGYSGGDGGDTGGNGGDAGAEAPVDAGAEVNNEGGGEE